MRSRPWNVAAVGLSAALALGVTACGPEVDDNGVAETAPYGAADAPGTAGTTGAGMVNYDTDIDTFLTDYIREDTMFADDDLDYEVSNGNVAVRGTVDSEAERTALNNRIGRVPGVRGVDLANVNVGTGS
jgi:osmotically-inducible protein OsmY